MARARRKRTSSGKRPPAPGQSRVHRGAQECEAEIAACRQRIDQQVARMQVALLAAAMFTRASETNTQQEGSTDEESTN